MCNTLHKKINKFSEMNKLTIQGMKLDIGKCKHCSPEKQGMMKNLDK